MRKTQVSLVAFFLILMLCLSAGAQAASVGIIGGASGPTTVVVSTVSNSAGTVPDDDPEPGATPTPTPAPTAAPVTSADFTITASLGYEGLFVMGQWMPCVVTVTNNGADFDGLIAVNAFYNFNEYDRYEMPLTLAGGATKRVVLPVIPLMRQDMYAFELIESGRLVAEKRVAPSRVIAPETMVIGLLSDDPAALTYLTQRANGRDTLRGESWLTVPLTGNTFPDTDDLMGCFSMLVVDGIDARTLSEAQQAALTNWLIKGGIVYVSGGAQAAASYPFFSEWTGLKAGQLTEAEDITPELLTYAGLQVKNAAGESIWLSGMETEDAIISRGGEGLLALHTAGKGYIYTAAFDMGGKPLSAWATMASFWPRMLRESIPDPYQQLLNRLDQLRYNNDYYSVSEAIRSLRIANTESGVPVLLLLLAYLAVAGFGGYLLLKKLDRREWLWGFVPASAVVFALILLLLSGGYTMNKPVALTVSRVLMTDDGAQVTTYIGVAAANGGELTVETDQNRLPSVVSDSSINDTNDLSDKLFRPVSLRQRYRLGAHPAVGFAGASAWDAKILSLTGIQKDVGTVQARLWMEADGVHGEVVNNTDTLLTDCLVLTYFGFDKIEQLLPGDRAQIAMLSPDKPVDRTATDFVAKPGVLYVPLDVDPASLSQQGGNMYGDVYPYLDAAFKQDEKKQTAEERQEIQRKRQLVDAFNRDFNYYQDPATYLFYAFNDTVGQIGVTLGGEPVTRTAHTAVIAGKAVFEPIGPTGMVFYHQGLIPAEVIVDQGDDKAPRLPTEADGESQNENAFTGKDSYIRLGAPVAFRLALPEWGKYAIERMTLYSSSYDAIPALSLYNHKTGAWDEQKLLTVSMDGDAWAPYIDAKGTVYARYVPSESGNRYDGMSRPMLTLKGKVNE